MPFQIIEGNIITASSEVRVEPFRDLSGTEKVQLYPLNSIDQYGEYDRLDTVSISEYSLTPARQKSCRYVIRTPVAYGEHQLCNPNVVRYCYKSALQIVHDLGLRSVAFPLIGISDGENSKELALQIAAEEIRLFLNDNEDTDILLVIDDRLNFLPDREVRSELSKFIYDIEVQEQRRQEQEWNAVQMASTESFPAITEASIEEEREKHPPQLFDYPLTSVAYDSKTDGASLPQKPQKERKPDPKAKKPGLILPFSLCKSERPTVLDESFSQMLFRKIDEKGFKKDSDFYKKANITKQTFSKMKTPDYHPKKTTAGAAAIALELSLDGTNELLMKAGYCLSHSLRFDIIVEYFISEKIYDIDQINISLFDYDQPLLGG